jgi:hypothetical protein
MSRDIHREEKRLRRIFARALWIAIVAPVAAPVACGSQQGTSDATGSSDASCAPTEFTPDPPDTCGVFVRLPCGLPSGVTPDANCYLLLNDCSSICPGPFFNCHSVDESCVDGGVVSDSKGGVDIDCTTCPGGVGRVPAGLARARLAQAPGPLGDYFAAAAYLEAASVHAFRRLVSELAGHRAPAGLRRAARRAQRDEVRHARLTARMARRFGGAPVPARVEPLATRTLDVIAIENAVEGCVRETFGALVASFQAANARDPKIARLMASIARDETRHAALSWAVARWARRRLGAEADARIGAHCRSAVETLRQKAGACVPDDLALRAGLPNAEQQRALLSAIEPQLWGCGSDRDPLRSRRRSTHRRRSPSSAG